MRPVSLIAALLVAPTLVLVGVGCTPICDGDGDGFCAPDDCDDTDPNVHPEMDEYCNGVDDDCSGGIPTSERDDADEDGVADCLDCSPIDPTTYPDAPEVCDGFDNDCDGRRGPGETDGDEDSWLACDECNDDDPKVYPGAEEICDELDSNCDGVLPPDEVDMDQDGFLECDGDCNPGDESIHPGAEEVCEGQDSDCDGEMLPGEDIDEDGDTHPLCADCDDANFSVSPDVEEICDGIDNNCDGEPYLDPVTLEPREKDDDEDGWLDCEGDCEDENPLINPAAYEILENGEDEDCDGSDNPPGWTPLGDPEEMMLQQLDGECFFHYGTTPVTESFDSGSGGFGGVPGVTIVAEREDNFVGLVYDSGGWSGSGHIATDGPVDSMTLTFDRLQDLVVFGIDPATPAASADYDLDVYQYGASIIRAPLFGTASITPGWNLRGAFSHNNIGFDTLVFLPPSGPEVIRLDDLSFCISPL